VDETMETSNVVIASDDNELTEILCRVCHTAGLGTISSLQTQLAPVLMESGRLLVLCVDARLESKPHWPLYHDIADSKDLRRIPMILILQPGQRLSYQFPKDHCVYTIVAGERLSSTFAIVSRNWLTSRELCQTNCQGKIVAAVAQSSHLVEHLIKRSNA
jgi:hypothetical protein